MKTTEIVSGEFDIRFGLNKALEDEILNEEDLLTRSEAEGVDLGTNPKPRLNYVVSLMILRKPKPVQYGKGKGGTRRFQRDAFECLEYVHKQSQNFALNEIRDIVMERQNDLVKKAGRELNIETDISNHSTLKKAARNDVNIKCHFSYDLIKADVLLLKLVMLHELLIDAHAEIAALKSLIENLGGALCGDCGVEVTQYIEDKEGQEKTLLDIFRKDLEIGKEFLEKLKE